MSIYRFRNVLLVALAVTLVGPASVFSQKGTRDPGERGGRERPAREGRERPAREDRARSRSRVQQDTAKLQQLQRMMHEKLDLSDAQKREIDAAFDAHLEEAARGGTARPPQLTQEQKDQLAARGQALRDAIAAGDEELADAIKAEMRQLSGRDRAPRRAAPHHDFLVQVGSKLNPEQKEKFVQMVERIGLKPGGMGGPERQLLRILNSRDLGLTDDQRAAVREIARQHLGASRGADPDKDGEGSKSDFASFKSAVFSILTAEQRQQVEQILEAQQQRRSRSDKAGEGDRPGK